MAASCGRWSGWAASTAAIEFLPDDESVTSASAQRHGLTRPELAVLLAYAKIPL